MEKIHSKVDPKRVLQIIQRKRDISIGRNELTEVDWPLQSMGYSAPAEKEFPKHDHNPIDRKISKTQEGFVVVSGKLELTVFDIDRKEVAKVVLEEGDCAILVDGGHALKSLTPVVFYEFKNGPYLGREIDKTYF